MPDAPAPKKLMSKKIAGVPMPIAVVGAAVVLYLVYRHFKTANPTSPAASTNAVPNSDLSTVGAPPSTNGTGTGGVGSGLSVADLQGLLQSLQGLQGPSYFYGAGAPTEAAPTFANTTDPGAGSTSSTAPVASQTALPRATVAPQAAAPQSVASTPTAQESPVVTNPPIDIYPVQPFYATPTIDAIPTYAGPEPQLQTEHGGTGAGYRAIVANAAQGNFVTTPVTAANSNESAVLQSARGPQAKSKAAQVKARSL